MNPRHWWIFDAVLLAFTLTMLLYLYGCGEFVVGLKPAATATSRPYVEVVTGPATYDRWLPYAMTGAALVAWLLPSAWPIRRRHGKR